MGTAILCQTGLSRHLQFLTLPRALLSVRVPGCQKLQTTAESGLAQDAVPYGNSGRVEGLTNHADHRVLYVS